MKRLSLSVLILVLLATAFPALAQGNPDLITLNDGTPAIDVVITLPPDTTGTIALDFALASVQLTDASDATVFYAADPRLHGLEFNLAPNSGSHTLTIERLPGAAEAYIRVASLPEMTVNGTAQLIEGDSLTVNQEVTLPLDAGNPGGMVTVNVPEMMTGVVTATFPGASAMTQLVDSEGVVLAESTGGHVDGLTFVLDTGDYDFTVLGSELTDTVIAGVRAVSSEVGGFTVLEAPAVAANDAAVPDQAVAAEAAVPAQAAAGAESPAVACTATITASSVNLRSGPGTGYSVLDYGYRGESFPVGGQNPESNWIVIGTENGASAWLALSGAQVQGACDTLTVFNIPLQEAAPAQLVITAPGAGIGYSGGEYEDDDDPYEYSNGGGDDEGGEHESYENEGGEYGDDD